MVEKLLVKPNATHLEGYKKALATGWSPNNLRPEAAAEELVRATSQPKVMLAEMDDPMALGPAIVLPDGRKVDRLPSVRRFIWDRGFCGVISLRWPKDQGALPDHVSGHIGYAVIPTERGRGLATQALAELLPIARKVGLDHVDLTADPDNIASCRVIEKNDGKALSRKDLPKVLGGGKSVLYRIQLTAG